MTRTCTARRGYAVVLTRFFVLLFTAMLDVLFRFAATTVRIETDRAMRSRCDEGSIQAMARAMTLLETGLPLCSGKVKVVVVINPGGP
jgi:hypothetical protein